MKLELTLAKTKPLKIISFIGIIMLAVLAFNPIYGQTNIAKTTNQVLNGRIIKGIVTEESLALEGVNVIQKGTRNGTVTNEKGEFTFPNKLKTGDVLLFSYLGYVTQEVEIKENTTSVFLKLTTDLVEMIGALDSGKPYKSKRKN